MVGKMLSALGYVLTLPVFQWLRPGKWVATDLYGQRLMMPAEHPLPATITEHALFNIPLGLAAGAVGASGRPVSVIDVGANIGETVAVIEQRNPGRCVFLCVEPSPELAQFCRLNHAANERVTVAEAFVGENEDQQVMLVDDGRANPSTRAVSSPTAPKLRRLDTLAADFVARHGVDLIKSDTEGYDFAVLRSAESMLRQHKPAVFFEWYPELLLQYGERPESIFPFLSGLGYKHWVFFDAGGGLYCQISEPTARFLDVLAKTTMRRERGSSFYFDVFGSVDQSACSRLADSAQ